MSEATKSAAESAKRPAQAGIDSSTKLAKDVIDHTSQVAQHTTDRASQAGQKMTEAVAEAAEAATSASSKAAEQGRDVMLMGLRSAASVGGQVGDISYGRGHHLLASAAQAMDIYHDASERSATRVFALVSSAMTLRRGIQAMQHAWMEMLDQAMEHATHKPQDMLRCTTLVEMAEVQRDLYVDAVNHAFASSSRMLELAGRTAQDAVRPLQTVTR